MNNIKRVVKKTWLLFFLILFFCLNHASTQTDEIKLKYRDFDFWIGDWEVNKFGTDTLVGISKIEIIMDSVAVKESYQSSRGAYRGTSINKYNSIEDRWEQYWIDNSGTTLHLIGGLEDGKMVLQNEMKRKNGSLLSNRITWEALEDGGVRQTWDQSSDNGVSWKTVFDGHYLSKM